MKTTYAATGHAFKADGVVDDNEASLSAVLSTSDVVDHFTVITCC